MLVAQSLWKLTHLGDMTLLTKFYLPFLGHTPSLSHAVKRGVPKRDDINTTVRTYFLNIYNLP